MVQDGSSSPADHSCISAVMVKERGGKVPFQGTSSKLYLLFSLTFRWVKFTQWLPLATEPGWGI